MDPLRYATAGVILYLMKTTTKTAPKPATTRAPFRFATAKAEIAKSEYGNPLPTLTLTGPMGTEWRAVRAAGLRVAADCEELLIGVAGAAVRLEDFENGVTITSESDTAEQAAQIAVAFEVAGRIARGLAGWSVNANGERVIVSVPR